MTELTVWAPQRQAVEVEVDGHRFPMTPGGGGWWAVEVPDGGAGSRYRYSLEGGPWLPDPRSAWQPEGINGASAIVDHGQFAWRDAAWRGRTLASGVIYELHVGTFSEEATFDGVIAHLDHLVDLGVTAIELLPVAQFSGDRGWGYDGVLLWAPHHGYGGPDGLRRLVDAAHERDLAVILDVVYNHLGPAGNRLAEYGPYFTDRYRTPWGDAVNYDGDGADEVRRFVIDNALMWLRDYHVDGLRLDAVHAIHDERGVHVLEALADAVERLSARLGRVLWLIAESERNDPRLLQSREAGGFGLDASWSDAFHHALHVTLTGEQAGYYRGFDGLPSLVRALERVHAHDGQYSAARRRSHGRRRGDPASSRLVGYLQNHDQVGNRAMGERSSALMSRGRLMIGAAMVLCGPFVPLLFQGEEWAASTPWQYFTDHGDPALGRAVAEGRARELAGLGWDPAGIPDPQDRSTWSRSRLTWSEVGNEDHARLLEWHRALIALRSELGLAVAAPTTASYGGAPAGSGPVTGGWLRVERGPVTVVAGLGPTTFRVAVTGRRPILLRSSPDVLLSGDSLTLPPDTVAVLGPRATDRLGEARA